MARAKKTYPEISKLSGLKWLKADEDTYRNELYDCNFCGKSIYEGDKHMLAYHPDPNQDPAGGDPLFQACDACALKSGLEW